MEKLRELEDIKKQEEDEISKVLGETLDYDAIPKDVHKTHSQYFNIRLKVGILIQSRQFQVCDDRPFEGSPDLKFILDKLL